MKCFWFHPHQRPLAAVFPLLLALLCAGFVAAGPADTNEVPAAPGIEQSDLDEAFPELELFAQALIHIRKHYLSEKTYQEVVAGALHGMLDALDPHSSYMEEQEFTEMKDDTSGSFSGIGIHIGIRNEFPTVIAPIEDTPAFRAGLQSGDRILEIDGEKSAGLSLREVVKRLRGEKGSSVKLSVQGLDEEEPREVEIIRDDIQVLSVKGARLIQEKIGYIRITQFSAPTAELLEEKTRALLEEGMEALVLDLRGNPGGLLKSAVAVSSLFLDKGDVIVSTRGREDVYGHHTRYVEDKAQFPDFPMAVLVNGGSASASEIVAGALQDNHRAVVVGTTTFGKASVQSVIPLGEEQKSAIRLTIAQYFTPSGKQIHEKGLEPDIPVPVPPEEWRRVMLRRAQLESPQLFEEEEIKELEDVVDRQLQRAADLLQAVKIFK